VVRQECHEPLRLTTDFERYIWPLSFKGALHKVFHSDPSNSTLAGFSLLLSTLIQSLYIGYPSKYNPDYLNINSSDKGSFYPSVLQVFNTTNYTSFALVRQEQNITFLVICKRTDLNVGMILPCIHLKAALLAS
jgi:hypothetical protein